MLFFKGDKNINPHTCGGKANNLNLLNHLGVNIPNWCVLSNSLFKEVISGNNPLQNIDEYQFDEKIIDQIEKYLSDYEFLAVRSSCIDEDGTFHSFAGLFQSILFVRREKLVESIKQVWLSAFSNRVEVYKNTNEIHSHPSMAVVIQGMVDSEVSGVAFGINPVSGNRKEHFISAVYGVGEGIVSGELDADNFVVCNNQIISKHIAEKKDKLVRNHQGGLIKDNVQQSLINLPCLTDAQIIEVSKIINVLNNYFKRPQDIEFAFRKNQFYLLQSRPVTTLDKVPDVSADYILWDNSNIIESYPGITSPLTFSFIINVYETAYKQFCKLMGVTDQDIEENNEIFANMLGLLNGRVYYNLKSWYQCLALLPGYSLNAEFMEKMMGVKERFELKDLKVRSKFSERLRVLQMIRIMIKNYRALPQMHKKFVDDFNLEVEKFEMLKLTELNSVQLMELYFNLEKKVLKKWKAPLVNDFFAMIYFGTFQKMVAKLFANDVTIHNDLLCGERNIISTEPIKQSIQLSSLIYNHPVAKNLFVENTPDEIWNELNKNKQLNPILGQINSYINKFGERCVCELKLETLTYKQNPVPYIQILKSYVEQGVIESYHNDAKDVAIRNAAEKKLNDAIGNKPLKKMLVNYFLRHSRRLVSGRENLRFERTRAFGIVRKIFIAIGDDFYKEGIIENARDIFYLTKEEIFNYIKGTSVNTNLKSLIIIRKDQYNTYNGVFQAERIKTHGITYQGNNFTLSALKNDFNGELKGLGCCPGRVKARVRVIHSPDEIKNLNGDILVTSSTDPGWVTLFPTASAIMVERGSLLSHSAIVSREMGKPCIVGIKNLLSVLKTGDLVEMDGATGEIKIIEKIDAK